MCCKLLVIWSIKLRDEGESYQLININILYFRNIFLKKNLIKLGGWYINKESLDQPWYLVGPLWSNINSDATQLQNDLARTNSTEKRQSAQSSCPNWGRVTWYPTYSCKITNLTHNFVLHVGTLRLLLR